MLIPERTVAGYGSVTASKNDVGGNRDNLQSLERRQSSHLVRELASLARVLVSLPFCSFGDMPDDGGSRQMRAIHIANSLGHKLAVERPGIEIMFRNHISIRNIADEIGLADDPNVSSQFAYNIVRNALRELMSPEDYARISREHQSEAGSNTKKRGVGIFSDQERTEPHEREKKPFLDAELIDLIRLCGGDEHQRRFGRRGPDFPKITEELNAKYGNEREPDEYRKRYRRMRK
jgi:hypothetical protein